MWHWYLDGGAFFGEHKSCVNWAISSCEKPSSWAAWDGIFSSFSELGDWKTDWRK